MNKQAYYHSEDDNRARKVIGNFLSDCLLQFHHVQKLRKEKSLPILGDLYSQIESHNHDKLTRNSDLLQKAINYAYHELKAVVQYIENGNWSMDNNEVKANEACRPWKKELYELRLSSRSQE